MLYRLDNLSSNDVNRKGKYSTAYSINNICRHKSMSLGYACVVYVVMVM